LPLSRFRQVVIFCPVAITGGPEAIHQLSQSLNAIGVDGYIVYVGGGQRMRITQSSIEVLTPPHEDMVRAYAAYEPRFRSQIAIDERTLVILPESLARHNSRLTAGGVAIWWLSVDNAFRALSIRVDDPEAQMAQILGRPDLIHLHQSAYARDWLRAQGVERLHALSDYTSPIFTAEIAKAPSSKPIASCNGVKGSELAEIFFARHPQFEALALCNYAKPELKAIFGERMLYVDFGHFPGKDRLPREAAISGSIVFVHRVGAAAGDEDFPLPDDFKFTEPDVTSGALLRRLEAVIADPVAHWDRQDRFRSLVAREKARFHDQVRGLWGARRNGRRPP
jgi:hypothetical protein